MIRYLLALLFVLFPALAEAGQAAASRVTSPGGIAFTLLRMPGAKKVAISVAWATDWAYRKDVNQAAPAVGSKLIFAAGAEGYPAGKAGEIFADLKAGAALFVTADHVIGELIAPRENLERAIAIANAHLRAPKLDETWFQRIRSGVARQMAALHARPTQRALDVVDWAVYGDQPLRLARTLDDPAALRRLERKDVVAWHGRTFSRGPVAVVVAGDIDAQAAGKAIDALFAGLPEGKPVAPHGARADFSPRRILLHAPDAKVSVLAFVAPLPPTRAGDLVDEAADIILTTVLARPDGPVFGAVRGRLHASYGFRAGINLFTRAHRVLFLIGQVETGKLGQAEKAVRGAYAAFHDKVAGDKLLAMKAPLQARMKAARRMPLRMARAELQGVLDGREPGAALKLEAVVNDLTEERLRARLKKAFPPAEGFITVAISPKKDALPGACVIGKPEEAVRCRQDRNP